MTTVTTTNSKAALEAKARQLLSWMNDPLRPEEHKRALSDRYFDVVDQLRLAA